MGWRERMAEARIDAAISTEAAAVIRTLKRRLKEYLMPYVLGERSYVHGAFEASQDIDVGELLTPDVHVEVDPDDPTRATITFEKPLHWVEI